MCKFIISMKFHPIQCSNRSLKYSLPINKNVSLIFVEARLYDHLSSSKCKYFILKYSLIKMLIKIKFQIYIQTFYRIFLQ